MYAREEDRKAKQIIDETFEKIDIIVPMCDYDFSFR